MFENLKAEMAAQEMDGDRLAKMSYISSADFRSAISGRIPFYPKWRCRIADALGVPESKLFDDEK